MANTLSHAKTITLLIALATLASNTLSAVLVAQIPDDRYYLVRSFGWYLHGANVISVFGLIGALRQHALSISLFGTYLFLDAVICLLARIALLSRHFLPLDLCAPSPLSTQIPGGNATGWRMCDGPGIGIWMGLIGVVVVAAVLETVGAWKVREYARGLYKREAAMEMEEGVASNGSAPVREVEMLIDVDIV